MRKFALLRNSIGLILAFVFLFAFTACSNQATEDPKKTDDIQQATQETKTDKPSDDTDESEPQKLFEETTTFTILCSDHPSYPYSEDVWAFNAVEDAANVELDVIAVIENFNDKFNVTMASGDLPDIVYGGFVQCNQYYDQGAFVPLSSRLDEMPTVKAYMGSNEEFAQNFNVAYAMPDGETYILPLTGDEIIMNKIGWMFRKDIFEKNDLNEFETDEQMYQALKELKGIYPDSYPLSFRKGVLQLHFIAPSYGTSDEAYYDYDTEEWKFGPISDEFKQMVIFYNKLYEESLIPPDFLSFSTSTWENTIITSSAFVTIDYYNRTNMFNGALTEEDPTALLAYTPGPKGSTLPAGEERILIKSGFKDRGAMVCNASKQDDAIKYLDWLYTDEAAWLTSWGIEGETFEFVDEKPVLFLEEGETRAVKYGFDDDGLGLRSIKYAFGIPGLQEYVDACNASEDIEQENYNPLIFLKYTPDQQEIASTIGSDITTYVSETISKFLVGEKDISEWDSYVAEVEGIGLEQYLNMLDEAFNAINK